MVLDNLKMKYDTVSIENLEEICKRFTTKAADYRSEFILSLYYLERTKRYKENPIYTKSSFEIYINNLFNLRYSTYKKERFAFISFPDLAKKWGPGLIDKIRHKCGAGKVVDVVNLIELQPNINHNQIEKIIKDNSKPIDLNKTNKQNKMSLKELEKENIKNTKTIAEYIKTIWEKDAQIAKLIMTVQRLTSENIDLKQKLEGYKNIISSSNNMQILEIVDNMLSRAI
jgi:hypothetical protein